MVVGLFVTFKLATALAKEMVNFETAKRITPSLIHASREWLIKSFQQQHNRLLRNHLQQQQQQHRHQDSEHQDQKTISTEYLVNNWLEALFAWFQVVVLWHEPEVSLCALSGLISSFLLLTYFAPRFYAAIMIALFVYNLNKFWFRHVWPEIRVPPEEEREEEMRLDVDRWTYLHPHLMTMAELGQYTRNLIKLCEHHLRKLLIIRQERPVAFCSMVCSLLACTAYIGNRISGMSLIFFTMATIVSAPGIYLHLLPEAARERLRRSVGTRLRESLVECDQSAASTTISNNKEQEQTAPALKGKSSPIESLASSSTATAQSLIESVPPQKAASTFEAIESQAISLFDTIMGKRFLSQTTNDTKSDTSVKSPLQADTEEELKKVVDEPSPLTTVTSTEKTTTRASADQSHGDDEQRKEEEAKPEATVSPRPRRDSKKDSDESISLIDSEDDQNDDFVML